MEERDVIVVGGGISGLALAGHAARAGRRAVVLEAAQAPGGCLDSRRAPGGYWLELGAHTLYNSYASLLELAEGCTPPPAIIPRADARKRFGFLRHGALTMMGPLSVFKQFRFWSLVGSVPRGLFSSKRGKTTREHFSRLVGARNYAEVLAPFLSAVPSQVVDEFPAQGPGSLFKKRARRKDVIKSFTFDGGVGAVIAALARSGPEVVTGAAVTSLARAGDRYEARTADGRAFVAPLVAVATDPATAARLVAPLDAALGAALAGVRTVGVDSVGVVVAKGDVRLPELAFVVPQDDVFWSAVSRDPVPDPARRAFTFHFRPGLERAARVARVSEVLGVAADRFEVLLERHTVLPSPGREHGALVAELDRRLAAIPGLALTGNYFAGLAIEDCAARSKSEWARVAGVPARR